MQLFSRKTNSLRDQGCGQVELSNSGEKETGRDLSRNQEYNKAVVATLESDKLACDLIDQSNITYQLKNMYINFLSNLTKKKYFDIQNQRQLIAYDQAGPAEVTKMISILIKGKMVANRSCNFYLIESYFKSSLNFTFDQTAST